MIDALEEGADLVSGWKAERRDGWTKRAASKVFNGVTSASPASRCTISTAASRRTARRWCGRCRCPATFTATSPSWRRREGFRVREMAVNHRPRRYGRSKYGLERYVRGFLDLLTIMFIGRFRWRPMHLFGGLGLAFSIVGFAISVYMAILKIAGHSIGERPLLLLGVLLIVVGVQLFTIGLLSEMIQRNHLRRDVDEVAARIDRVID